MSTETSARTYQCPASMIHLDVVTIQAIALDSSGQKINENQRSFFAWERGPIGPGFKGTLKIPVEIGSAKFKSMECSVIVAK